MGLSLDSLQILASLNLTTEQMAGVVRVLTVELAPLEAQETKLAAQRDKARLRKAKSRGCHVDNPVTEAGQASRVDNNSSLTESIETVSNPLVIPPAKPAASSEPPSFPVFWSTYPKRAGDRDRKAALKAFSAATRRVTPETIIAGAARYAAHCDQAGKTGTEFVRQARTWLNADGWNETYEISRSMTNGSAIHDNWAKASAVLAEQDRIEGICREGREDDLRTVSEPQGWPGVPRRAGELPR